MTRERAKELAPIMQAYGEGKEIQTKDARGEWTTLFLCPEWRDGCDYRIKPTPSLRPMTRGEVLYMVTTTPGMVVRYGRDEEPQVPAYYAYDDGIDAYEYAIIDKHGNPGEWKRFEVEDIAL
jgi:hypothetical protein